jgi:hypothetical protein
VENEGASGYRLFELDEDGSTLGVADVLAGVLLGIEPAHLAGRQLDLQLASAGRQPPPRSLNVTMTLSGWRCGVVRRSRSRWSRPYRSRIAPDDGVRGAEQRGARVDSPQTRLQVGVVVGDASAIHDHAEGELDRWIELESISYVKVKRPAKDGPGNLLVSASQSQQLLCI